MLSRDAIKESLWDAMPVPELADPFHWSQHLGGVAFDVFWQLAPVAATGTIFDVHLRHDWVAPRRDLLPATTAELFLTANPGVVHRRQSERLPDRHACHRHHPLPSLEELEEGRDNWRPANLGGPLLVVDTSDGVDLPAILNWVTTHASIT